MSREALAFEMVRAWCNGEKFAPRPDLHMRPLPPGVHAIEDLREACATLGLPVPEEACAALGLPVPEVREPWERLNYEREPDPASVARGDNPPYTRVKNPVVREALRRVQIECQIGYVCAARERVDRPCNVCGAAGACS